MIKITKRKAQDCRSLSFEFNIRPKAKQGVQQGKTKAGKKIFFRRSKVSEFEKQIWAMTLSQMVGKKKLNGALHLEALYIFKLPSNANKEQKNIILDGGLLYRETTPDLTDNVNKGVIDGLKNLVMEDDCQIASFYARKAYGEKDSIYLTFNELPNPTTWE